ncbi:MAG: V-type sodium ATPase subunit G [Elusimicrobia bacterium ADurb.Bin231]|nr:MAG: V-type sodium ATPase subunit G [Elusimicrobia bacterium ADurb.Bin231]
MSSKICFIGIRDEIDIWKQFGSAIFSVNNGTEAREAVKKAIENGFDLIFVTETVSEEIPKFMEKLDAESNSIITIIPGIKSEGESDPAIENLKNLSIKATGSNVVK